MSTSLLAGIVLLVLGFLFLTVWAVHFLLTILGWVLIIAGAVWLFRAFTGRKSDRL
jgi:uncharacterized membrane protein HdeD (DUF308 family)